MSKLTPKQKKAVCALWDALANITAEHADEGGCFELPDEMYAANLAAQEKAAAAFPDLLEK